MASALGALWALLKYGLISTISVGLAFAILVHYTPELGRQANAIRRLGRVVTGPLTSEEYKLERLPPGVITPEIQDILEKHHIEEEEELERLYGALGLSSETFIAFGPTERVAHYYCVRWRDEKVRRQWHDWRSHRVDHKYVRLMEDLTEYLRLHCK